MTVTKVVFASRAKKFWEVDKKRNSKQQSEGAHFRYQRTEAELYGQKTVTLIRTTKVSSSARMISSPANFFYPLGIADREVGKDKETFFTRKFLAHQETAIQYYMVGILM